MSTEYDSIKTDGALLQGVQNQDESQWSKFYDRYAIIVMNFARKLGCSTEMSEDILQDTMTTLFRVMPEFHYQPKRGKFRSYLFKITESKIRDAFRKNKRFKFLLPFSEKGSSKEIPSEKGISYNLDECWDKAFEENILSKAIAVAQEKVHPSTFKSFTKVFIEKKDVKEVARLLSIPANRVSQHKHNVCKIIIQEAKKLRNEYGE